MLKFDVGESFGDLECWLHIAKGSGKDQLVPSFSQLGNRTLGIRSFGHTFNVGRFHMITEHIVDHQAALIMGIGPAMIPRWANIDKSNFQLVCRRSRDRAETQHGCKHHYNQFDKVLHFQFPPFMVRIPTGAILLNAQPETADPGKLGR